MRNELKINNSTVVFCSSANDGTNSLYVNGSLIPSSNWIGTGSYITNGVTIDKTPTADLNVQCVKITDNHYKMVERTKESEITYSELVEPYGVGTTAVTSRSDNKPIAVYTQNLDENGNVIDTSGYGDNTAWTRTVSFTAGNVNAITAIVTFQTESTSFDWGCVWDGADTTKTAAANYSTALGGKLGGTTKQTMVIEIPSNACTIAFKSDSSVSGYYGMHVLLIPSYKSSSANDLLNMVYPVGSIYMSVNSTSPATFIGGTWQRLYDRMLIGGGSSYSTGSTGGSTNVTPSGNVGYTTLSESQIPYISGGFKIRKYGTSAGITVFDNEGTVSISNNATASANTVSGTSTNPGTAQKISFSFGGGNSHGHSLNMDSQNNMPPYLSVYMWKRTG